MKKKTFYGKGIPGVNLSDLKGMLIALEGSDGSGRTTQSALLRDWLGRLGYPTVEVGLKRSELVGLELEEAMRGNTLHPQTLSLFYATDFASQMETSIIPSLRAGFIVIADRYIYTLMARDIVRGANREWLKNVYGMALIPDLIFYLDVSPKLLVERSFQKKGSLDYWESGMDIQRSGDVYQCFIRYQTNVQKEFRRLVNEYGFKVVNGSKDPLTINEEIKVAVKPLLQTRKTVPPKSPSNRGMNSSRHRANGKRQSA